MITFFVCFHQWYIFAILWCNYYIFLWFYGGWFQSVNKQISFLYDDLLCIDNSVKH